MSVNRSTFCIGNALCVLLSMCDISDSSQRAVRSAVIDALGRYFFGGFGRLVSGLPLFEPGAMTIAEAM